MSTDLQTITTEPSAIGAGGIVIRNVDDLARVANMAYRSGMAGKRFANVEAVGMAIAMGLELGLKPIQAVNSIIVINGRPGLDGAGALAVCEASGLMEEFEQWYEVAGVRCDDVAGHFEDTTAACCLVKRRGRSKSVTRFTVGNAKRAGLWNKEGPWKTYPERMLRWRALGFALNDAFPDILHGIKTTQELDDYPTGGDRRQENGPRPNGPRDNGPREVGPVLEHAPDAKPEPEPEPPAPTNGTTGPSRAEVAEAVATAMARAVEEGLPAVTAAYLTLPKGFTQTRDRWTDYVVERKDFYKQVIYLRRIEELKDELQLTPDGLAEVARRVGINDVDNLTLPDAVALVQTLEREVETITDAIPF